uniref:Protein kinase domain-containing protein n=1 Tax=Manihot esculenta TaxID=3983 RepID=A0A2C9UNE9_MANES
MASYTLLPLLLILLMEVVASASNETGIHPFVCNEDVKKCNASLYHINKGLQMKQVAFLYSVNSTQISPILRENIQDYLVTVPCSCKTVNGTRGYFYDASYKVLKDDTFLNVSKQNYSGQAWEVEDEEDIFKTGNEVPMHLLCGCVENDSQVVVTYTVQNQDTLSGIASRLSSTISAILSMNGFLNGDPSFIQEDWVLYIPKEMDGIPAPPPLPSSDTASRKRQNWTIIIGILSATTLLLMTTLIIIFLRRKGSHQNSSKDPKTVSTSMSTTRSRGLSLHILNMEIKEDGTALESDKPVIYTAEEIEEATNNFDETRKIGAGGYGSVYFGVMGEQEVAIKKMKSNKSREFFAEVKVLCKVHHINVVELLGYASGDDHLYLVYEYIRNGSLSDHLHDPLLKGYQPLSWVARTQIALDAAKGIEYIHDHTKKRYVHRDIKSTNILLDEGLRAKVLKT